MAEHNGEGSGAMNYYKKNRINRNPIPRTPVTHTPITEMPGIIPPRKAMRIEVPIGSSPMKPAITGSGAVEYYTEHRVKGAPIPPPAAGKLKSEK